MIVVFDASSLVGAALKQDSKPMRALQAARVNHTIALSNPVFDEIREVLGRPKFVKALTQQRQHEILELLNAAAIWFEPQAEVTDYADPKDNKYLALAASSRAEVIVSSDKHLLLMDPWRGIRIMSPSDYLDCLPSMAG